MTDSEDPVLTAVTSAVPPLLNALEALTFAGRYLHPPNLQQVIGDIEQAAGPLKAGYEVFAATAWPDNLARFRDQIDRAITHALRAFDELEAARDDDNAVLLAYRALRHTGRAMEALYPVSIMLPPVSRFFLEPRKRDDEALIARLADADPLRDQIGVLHANNDKQQRGGVSLYVPEYYDPAQSYPVIFALHGGSGHGRDFLWFWLREARSRGAILVSPTSRLDTWSLMEPGIDVENLLGILERLGENWTIDRDHLLLTGMSDGGTFTLLTGLGADSPFTHLAPISGSFHPMMLEVVEPARIKDLPIYLTHGALDWMFPPTMAREAHAAFERAGAAITYREIADLSHTYPREENARIMDWFLDGR